jgi:hypothetical protein
MSFLSGLGKGLSRAFDGTNLAIAQAILAGDYQGAAALRARQGELQRQLRQDRAQNDARDAQVIGAKNMGFNGDEIDGMSSPELSAAIRQRALARMLAPAAVPAGGEGDGDGVAPSTDAAPDPLMPGSPEAPGKMRGTFDPERTNDLVERRIPYKIAQAFLGRGAPSGFGGAIGGAAPTLPRANTPGHAAALPKGSPFIAPDGSIRRKI